MVGCVLVVVSSQIVVDKVRIELLKNEGADGLAGNVETIVLTCVPLSSHTVVVSVTMDSADFELQIGQKVV